MKKLLTVILILALLLPAAAWADDLDPIVASWYMVYDTQLYPEMAANFPGIDFAIAIYTFRSDGRVMCTENDVSGDTGTPMYNVAGKWSKENGTYNYSIIGLGEGTVLLENDQILLSLKQYQGAYMRLHKMIPFDPYSDYVIK